MKILAAPAFAMIIGACATVAEPPVHGETPGRTCDAAPVGHFVGREATASAGADMLRLSNAAVLRWVAHGTVITMEYRADRLTVKLDPNNRIESVVCT